MSLSSPILPYFLWNSYEDMSSQKLNHVTEGLSLVCDIHASKPSYFQVTLDGGRVEG